MSLDHAAIQAIADLAIQATDAAKPNTDKPTMALPESFTIHDLEKHQHGRYRFRGAMATKSLTGFTEYCEDNKSADVQCFVNRDRMSATAVFNIGTADAPGHCDHTSTLTLEQTPEFAALMEIEGKAIDQRAAAEFLEDWRELLSCVSGTGEDARELSVIQAIASVRSMKTLARSEAGHKEGNFASARTALEERELADAALFPSFIHFRCAPYEDLQERSLTLRVSTTHSEHKPPTVTLRLVRKNQIIEDIAKEFAAKISEELAGVTDKIYLGSFSA